MSTDQQIHHRNEINRHARTFLNDQLARGPQPLSLIRERATKQGVSLSSLLTAKRSLNVESHLIDRRAIWSLPNTV
jgi:hypothetical protein